MNKLLLLLTFCFILPFTLLAQDRTVKGKVTDDNGSPIAGANVIQANARKGAQTDKAGNFSLSVSGTGTVTLVVSSIGYGSTTVVVTGNETVNVRLVKEAITQEDVVVV